MNLFNGKVGLRRLQRGAEAPIRLSPRGGLVTQNASATYQEAVRNGNCYTGQTAATGVAPGTSVSTTAAFCLYNPVGSGVMLVVWKASMGFVSATAMGAGTVHYVASAISNTTAVTGTAIVPINLLLNNPAQAVAKPFTTATVPASPKVLRPFCSLQAHTTTTALVPWTISENVDGEFVILPGGYLSLHATAAAGTAPLVMLGMSWEESPIVT